MSCTNCGREGHSVSECTHEKRVEGLTDSSMREEFVTGMIREPNLMRGRYDLISPLALNRVAVFVDGFIMIPTLGLEMLAIHYERGALKYAPRNWEKGGYLSRYLNSAIRHAQKVLAEDMQEDHISAIVWNCFSIMHTEMMIAAGNLPSELNDLCAYDIEYTPYVPVSLSDKKVILNDIMSNLNRYQAGDRSFDIMALVAYEALVLRSKAEDKNE